MVLFIDGHSVLGEIMIHCVFDDKSPVVHASYKVYFFTVVLCSVLSVMK